LEKKEKFMPHIFFFLLFSLISARYHWKKKEKSVPHILFFLLFSLISARYHWKRKEKPMTHILFFLLFSLISAMYHWKKKKNHGDVSKDRMPKLAEALGSRPSLMLNFVGIFVVYLDSIGDDTKHILSFTFVERVLKMECLHINFFSH